MSLHKHIIMAWAEWRRQRQRWKRYYWRQNNEWKHCRKAGKQWAIGGGGFCCHADKNIHSFRRKSNFLLFLCFQIGKSAHMSCRSHRCKAHKHNITWYDWTKNENVDFIRKKKKTTNGRIKENLCESYNAKKKKRAQVKNISNVSDLIIIFFDILCIRISFWSPLFSFHTFFHRLLFMFCIVSDVSRCLSQLAGHKKEIVVFLCWMEAHLERNPTINWEIQMLKRSGIKASMHNEEWKPIYWTKNENFSRIEHQSNIATSMFLSASKTDKACALLQCRFHDQDQAV